MSIRYPSFVDVNNIIETPSSKSKYRYVLEIPFCDGTGKPAVVVVLKNPSKATMKECDVTVSKVCNATHNEGYGKAIIFNLFPIRTTKPEMVFSMFIQHKGAYDKHMNINQKYLSSIISLVDDVIFAWGTNTIKHRTGRQYNEAKNEVKRICANKKWKMVEGGKREPLHGQRWSNESKFIDYTEYENAAPLI